MFPISTPSRTSSTYNRPPRVTNDTRMHPTGLPSSPSAAGASGVNVAAVPSAAGSVYSVHVSTAAPWFHSSTSYLSPTCVVQFVSVYAAIHSRG